MKRVMLVDDDRHEATFWRHIIDTIYPNSLSLEWHSSVDGALGALEDFQPEVVLLDNKIPPHDTAAFALSELRKREYGGAVYIWSFCETDALKHNLKNWPDVSLISKQHYTGMKIKKLIETYLL